MLYFLLLVAIYFDIRTFRIPNQLILFGLGGGALYHLMLPGEQSLIFYFLSMAGMFVVLIPVYRLHAVGGGDVKLLSLCAWFSGLCSAFSIAVGALFFGGIISILYLVYHRIFSKQKSKDRHVIHFSIPIFLGAVTERIWGGLLWPT